MSVDGYNSNTEWGEGGRDKDTCKGANTGGDAEAAKCAVRCIPEGSVLCCFVL